MKRLEQLGISQPPWRFADDGMGECDIRCSGVSYGEDYEGDDIIASSIQRKDAPMIAAAPDLYDCLREAAFMKCESCKERYRAEHGCEPPTCLGVCTEQCMVHRWQHALKRASGELYANEKAEGEDGK